MAIVSVHVFALVALALNFVDFVSTVGAKGSTAGISIPKSDAVVLSAAEIMEALLEKTISGALSRHKLAPPK